MTDKSTNDSSKTQTYSTSTNSDKTRAYGSEAAATQVYGQRDHARSVTPETQTYESQESPLIDKTQAHNLGIGDSVELNKKKYEITDVISSEGQTAEAIVYKIKDSQNKIFALKLYYEFRNPKNEPNTEALKRISKIRDPDILQLHDFGTGGNKYQNKFCFEICDFAEGGDLLSVEDIKEKYTPEFLEANVVPEIFKGIKKLHRHRIYHCDLNPRNVFFLDEKQEDLVIGDYGSAKTFEQDSEKSLARSSMTKGTEFYIAPEQTRGIISEKNDYYSFGMSLLHLLYPEQITKANFNRITERQFAGREILNFDPKYDRINKMIAGLTLQDINKRWGKAEVEGWLDGEDIEVRYPSETAVAPIKLGKVTIQTQVDLLQYIEGDDNWYDDLIDDEQGYKLLLGWLSTLQDLERKKTFDRMVRYYRLNIEGEDNIRKYVKEAVLRFFQPERPVQVEMRTYDLFRADNIVHLVDQFWTHMDDLWKITDLQELKYYLFQFEFSLRQLRQAATGNLKTQISALIDKISAILDVSSDTDFSDYQAVFHSEVNDERLLNVFYAFNPERTFRDLSGDSYDTIEKVGFFFADNQELFNNKYLRHETVKFLNKQDLNALSKKDYKDFLFTVFNKHIQAEIEFTGISFNNSECTISYRFGKSLSDYLKEQSINKSLVEMSQGNETIVVQRSLYANAGGIFKDYINELEKKHNIKKEYISTESKKKFKQDLRDNKKKFAQEKSKNKLTQFIVFINQKGPFFSATSAILVFIYLAMNWVNISGTIWDIYPPIECLDGVGKWFQTDDLLGGIIMLIPAFATIIALGLLWIIGALLFGTFAWGFPIIISLTIYQLSNNWLQHCAQDNIAAPNAIVLFYTLFILGFGGFLISETGLVNYFTTSPFNAISQQQSIRKNQVLPTKAASSGYAGRPRKEGIISVSAANVRERPSTKARKLSTLHRGEKVSILSVDGNWYRISMSDSRKGYIYKKLVSIGGKTFVPLTKKPPRLKEKAERTSNNEKLAQQQHAQVGARKEPVRSTAVKPSIFSVNIQSRPQGAIVFIDQKKAGVTPFVVDLELGPHGVKLDKPGYRSKWDIFRVEKNGRKNFLFRLETK